MRKQKWLSLLLCVVLVILVLPLCAFATSNPGNYVFDIAEGTIRILDGGTAGKIKVEYGGGQITPEFDPSQEITVTGSFIAAVDPGKSLKVETNLPVTVRIRDLTIDNNNAPYYEAMALFGDAADVTLILEGTNYLRGGQECAGIQVEAGRTLTIKGDGTLTAQGMTGTIPNTGAGIGGKMKTHCGTVIIESGTITAIGGKGSAGIGGGYASGSTGGNGGTVYIRGGNVTATGGDGAAGIGGGKDQNPGGPSGVGGSVTITGGTVTATGNNADDIGGGIRQKGTGTLTVNGDAWVTAATIGGTQNLTSGIVNGTVYGDVTLPASRTISDLTIPVDTSLTVPDGITLTIPADVTLTNNGTIVNYGTIDGTVAGNQPQIGAKYLDAAGVEQTAVCDGVITSENIGSYGTLNSGWYVVKGTVTADTRITVSGTVHLILADDCTLTANQGIGVNIGNSLTIYGQSAGTGTLTATVTTDTTYGNAGIGGTGSNTGGTITINGGNITATGGGNYYGGAGIGGGGGYRGGDININGGTVHATGGNTSYGGAGIGGGGMGSADNIIINGGTVTATGAGGAGIGGGDGGDGGTITITGGNITATGGSWSAGIGGGDGGTGGTITITGGNITATGGYNGAGMGSGYNSSGGTITITGGTVLAVGSAKAYSVVPDLEKGLKVSAGGSASNLTGVERTSLAETTYTGNLAVKTESCTAHESNTVVYKDAENHTLTCKWCGTESQEAHSFDANGQCTGCGIWRVSYLAADGSGQTAYCVAVTAETTALNASGDSSGWYVVRGTVTASSRITVSGTVHLILADGCNFTVSGGISVNKGNSLTIYGQSAGTGTLTATGGDSQAGIGGDDMKNCGTVTINGGIVNATGGNNGAGIGGGRIGNSGTITINGGIVNATGGNNGAGIGSGGSCSGGGGSITINGGYVEATGGSSGAGIGTGFKSSGGTITIKGGTIKATGSSSSAGIGGGSNYGGSDPAIGSGGTITISGGTVTATGGKEGVGIGPGIDGSGGTVTLKGGTVLSVGGTNGKAYSSAPALEKGLRVSVGGSASNLTDVERTSLAETTYTGNLAVKTEICSTHVNTAVYKDAENHTLTCKWCGNVSVEPHRFDANGDCVCGAARVTCLDEHGTGQITVCQGVKADNIGSYGTLTTGWYVVKGDVTASSRITVSGTVHLILADGCNFTVNGGIGVNSGNSLTIYGQSINASTMGKLTAIGSVCQAAIGGDGDGGTITINGGTVKATSPASTGEPAGIGGGAYGDCGTITITGGNIYASGCGKGIGGGADSTTGTIEISGGYVEANGIGTGNYSESHETSITGGVVVSTGSINQAHKNSWCGVIFEGNDGKVYGTTVTPTVDFTIASGKSLLIPTGSTLNISGINAVNNSSVYVDGTLSGALSGSGSYYYPLTVTGGTADKTYDYNSSTYGKAGETITLTGTDVPVGQAVSGWTVSDSGVTVVNNAFTMPAKALTVSRDGFVNAPTYTVTIPATVELGGSATVSASGVNVVSGSSLVVTLTDAQSFKLTTDEGAELSYGITKDSTALSVGSTVLTVAGGTADSSGSATLTFSAPTTAIRYSGVYKGTVTFTVAVQAGS